MINFTTDLMTALVQRQDLNAFFREQLETAMNQLLQAELSSVLGYEPYERSDSDNARNGQYSRTFDTSYGKLHLIIPRDRKGLFHQHLLPDYERRSDALETTIIQLYQKGVTTREIADLVEKMYGAYYSPTTISNLTQVVSEQIKIFHERPLSSQYVVVYLDATYLTLRRDTVAKEPVHLAIGITPQGKKEVLGYVIAPCESLEAYRELLDQLKSQGLKEVLLFVSDGFVGLSRLLSESFPKAKQQRCWVHLARTVATKVRKSQRQVVLDDFKMIYQSADAPSASWQAQAFLEKWQPTYPSLEKVLAQEHLYSFYEFPEAIQPSLYTNNLIEAYNKQLKRKAKVHIQFPNEESLERFLVTQFMDYNAKMNERTHKGFAQCADTLDALFI